MTTPNYDVDKLSSYQLWQLERYGDILPERKTGLFSCVSRETDSWEERQIELLPENLISKY